jgi:flavin reductase (DIM6/NTAB) family NADH-FMN oxidoreductase RutF
MADGTASHPSELTYIPGSADTRLLRDAFGSFATGVTVVTCDGPSGPVGMTANSFASVSLDPPLLLWSPARASSRFDLFSQARAFSIHVLAADQAEVAARFTRGGAGFDGLVCGRGATGAPTLDGALARFDCSLHAAHDGGDHVVILGRIHEARCRDGQCLAFCAGRYGAFLPFGTGN